jgi:hypothetical protein
MIALFAIDCLAVVKTIEGEFKQSCLSHCEKRMGSDSDTALISCGDLVTANVL